MSWADISPPAIGSRWYAYGRHVIIMNVFKGGDGALYVEERDERTGKRLPTSTRLDHWVRHAVSSYG